jgi:hypothetical protein
MVIVHVFVKLFRYIFCEFTVNKTIIVCFIVQLYNANKASFGRSERNVTWDFAFSCFSRQSDDWGGGLNPNIR